MDINILAVDDKKENLYSLEALLDDLKCDCVEFDEVNIIKTLNGEDALDIAINGTVDLIILDIQMPNMSGFEVAKFLKSNYKTKDIPIIFLTAAFKAEEFINYGFELGAIDYFTKPIEKYQFAQKIKLYLNLFAKNKKVELQKLELEEMNIDLKQREERFDFALQSSRDGFYDIDFTNGSMYLSDGWKKRLGFVEDSNIGYDDYTALINDDQKEIHNETLMQLVQTIQESKKSEHYRFDYSITTLNGEHIDIESVGEAFSDDNGIIKRMSGFHRDITLNVEQDKILSSQSRLAALGEMLNNISHQWRQPIGAINNVLNDIEFEIELDELEAIPIEQILTCSRYIKNYTSHLSKTIDDFKNFSKNEKEKKKFDVSLSIKEALDLTQHTLNQELISVNINNIECNVVFGHQRELTQVILNIINNAKDAMIEMNIKNREIFIHTETINEETIVNIEDNAGGIPKDVINNIFDPYFTTKHQSVGTGIGLYMSKRIIEEHFNGKIMVNNGDKGARFRIIFPSI